MRFDFFVEMLTTSLQPGEILREIRIPASKGKAAQAYVKVRHPASGFAVVGVAVNVSFFLMFEVWFKVPLFKGNFDPLQFLGY